MLTRKRCRESFFGPFFVLLVVLIRCTGPSLKVSETERPLKREDANLAKEIEREVQSPSLRRQALRFHQFVQGDLGPEAEEMLIRSCAAKTQNPFCFSISRRKLWSTFRHLRTEEPKPFPPKSVTPFPITVLNGKIVDLSAARRAEKQPLIKALSQLTLDKVIGIAHQALGENRCPNMAAIAAAATLEDFFPDLDNVKLVSQLYEHAARCMRGEPTDRENFLVRAALLRVWLKDTDAGIRILSRVRPADAFSGRPLYWLYRLYDESGDRARAQGIYRKLRRHYPFSFHAIVAASENGDDAAASLLSNPAPQKAKRSYGAPNLNRIVLQIEILHGYQHYDSAAVLVDWAINSFKVSMPLRLYLVELGDHKSKVSYLPELFIRKRHLVSRSTLEMAFPKAFASSFEKYSEGVDPLLLMSIACKESKFDTLAISPANARGLMQLSPITGTRLGARAPSDLFDPDINIRLGSTYVKELLGQWGGKGFLVLANYNAGEDALASWLRRFTMQDPLLFIDLIPYRETRDYIGFVLTNYYWYRRLYRNAPVAKIVAPDLAYRK